MARTTVATVSSGQIIASATMDGLIANDIDHETRIISNTNAVSTEITRAQSAESINATNTTAITLVPIATVTTSGALVQSSHNPVDATSGALTVTLPTPTTNGIPLSVEKYDATANMVTISGSIRGATSTIGLALQHETVEFVSGSGSWWPISGHKTLGSLDNRYPIKTAGLTTARALSLRAPSGPKPVNTTPNVTVSGSVPAATPTNITGTTGGASGSTFGSLNPAFTYVGGKYMKSGVTYPSYLSARTIPTTLSPVGFGSAFVEFWSDAPQLTIVQTLGQFGMEQVIVDGVEVYRCGAAIRTGTAQAGAASTITLDSGASATNGVYFTNWVRLTSGTGVGQTRQITGYVGSSKVATVSPAWTTTPDTTSVFAVESGRFNNNTSSALPIVVIDWNGERYFRHYRILNLGFDFAGVYVGAIDTVAPADPTYSVPTVWVGDSYSAGTGSDGANLVDQACSLLGWQAINVSIGGTGYLNPLPLTSGMNSLNGYDRVLPPVNSWWLRQFQNSGGTFTLTQGGITTGTIAYNATLATVASAVTAAFGAGSFDVVGDSAANCYLVGRGSNATISTAMTANFTGLTGSGQNFVQRWTGDVAPNVPLDGAGKPLPFNIVFAFGHNDTTSTNAAFTASTLTTQVTNLLNGISTTFPTATVYVVGNMSAIGGVGSDVTTANAAILAACTSALPLINGALPFIDTITVPWITGTRHMGALTGSGNADVCCWTDGIHPSSFGHALYARRIAQAITQILARQINP